MTVQQTLMLSPVAFKTYVVPSGNIYTADVNGIINNLQSQADISALISAGCSQLSPVPTAVIGKLLQANFNITTDQAIVMQINGVYRVKRIVVWNTTVNGMSTAAGGIYTAASKGGSAIVANSQTYTGLTNQYTAEELTLSLPNLVNPAGTPLFFSLTTAQGAAALADIWVYGDVYQ